MQEANFLLNEKEESVRNNSSMDTESQFMQKDSVLNETENEDDLGDLLVDNDSDIDSLSLSMNILFDVLQPNVGVDPNNSIQIIPGPVVGSSLVKDTSLVNNYLNDKEVLAILPNEFRNVKFLCNIEM